MTGIFTAKATPGRQRCARCGRLFIPTKEGQRYGPKCERKMAAQMQLDGKLFIGQDVMIKTESGNLCRACGTDISDEPDRQYCSECEDDPNVQAVAAYRRAVIV